MFVKKVMLLGLSLPAIFTSCNFLNRNNGDNPSGPSGDETTTHSHVFSSYKHDESEHWKTCNDSTCSEISEKALHEFEKVSSESKTCSHPDRETYRCKDCGYEKTVNIGTVMGEHHYISSITEKATCVEPGELTFTCSECSDTFKKVYTDADAHEFDGGTTNGVVTTYHCVHSGCDYVRTTIDAKLETETVIESNDLKAAGEIELKEAAIAFDENALEGFGNEEISIAAEPISVQSVVEELGEAFSNEIKEKIGDNKIIDFSLSVGEEKVSTFNGEVTITVPYELKANETEEGLVAWYLNEGEPIAMEAKLNNGMVSFKTTHFSYYTIVHLNPEEVCEAFGHSLYTGKKVDSTCIAHGYSDKVCGRCGTTIRTESPLVDHNFELVEKVEATSSKDGYIKYVCDGCHQEKKVILDRLSDKNNGILSSIIKSLGEDEFELEGSLLTDGKTYDVKGMLGHEDDGNMFGYINLNNGSDIFFKDGKGYSLSEYEVYEMPKPVKKLLMNFSEVINKIPNSVLKLVDDLGGSILSNCFDKSETSEGYTYKTSPTKFNVLLDKVVNENAGVIVSDLLGENFLSNAKELIGNVFDLTINELLEYIDEKYQLNAEEIFNATMSILDILGVSSEEMPKTFNEFLPEEQRSITLLDLVGSMLPSEIMSSVPSTKEQIIGMIEAFEDMKVLEIINQFTDVNETNFTEEIDFLREIFSKMSVEATTDANGRLLLLKATLDEYKTENYYGEEEIASYSFLLTKGVKNRKFYTDKIEKYAPIIDDVDAYFVMTEEHHDTIVDAFNKIIPGANFQYGEGMGNNADQKFIVSQNNLTYEYNETEITGKIIITLDDYAYYRILENRVGLGTVTAKGDIVAQRNLRSLVDDAYLTVDQNILNLPYDYFTDIHLNEYSLTYNITTGETSCKRFNDLSYLDAGYFKTSIISKDEFNALAGVATREYHYSYGYDPYDCIYLKHVNNLTGEINREKVRFPQTTYKNSIYAGLSNYFIDKEMDDEALYGYSTFYLRTVIEDGRIIIKPYAAYSLKYQDSDTYTVSDGNTTLTINKTTTNKECFDYYSWNIKVNGKVKLSGSYKEHDPSDSTRVETSKFIDPCTEKIVYGSKCNCCNQIYYDYTTYNYNHDYVLDTNYSIPSTHTQEGIEVMNCSVCGKHEYQTDDTCHHYILHSSYNGVEEGFVRLECSDCHNEYIINENINGYNFAELEFIEKDNFAGIDKFGFKISAHSFYGNDYVGYICYCGYDPVTDDIVISDSKAQLTFDCGYKTVPYAPRSNTSIYQSYLLVNSEQYESLDSRFESERNNFEGISMHKCLLVVPPYGNVGVPYQIVFCD